MDGSETVVIVELDLQSLRLAYKTTSDSLERWGGGDPAEQEFLTRLKSQLYRALMENLLNNEQL